MPFPVRRARTARHRAPAARPRLPRAVGTAVAAAATAAGAVAVTAAVLTAAAPARGGASAPVVATSPAPAAGEAGALGTALAAALAAAPAAQDVAAPAELVIPDLGIASPLVPLGTTASGALEVPADAAVAGWFTGGPAPGARGPAVIAGHVDSTGGPGVFADLDELEVGDAVQVRRTDGTTADFVVTGAEQVAKTAFPSDVVYGAAPGPQLRLVTCGGAFDRASGHYEDNLVVYARTLTPAPA
ncbi:class F sortase [Quadrisphaera sp. DSM 44207]|uniref:class F sortase n=1 Tax=Quadrisphaera sp. DSM 44207 TaxID=1881057 RepID=UPI00088CC6CD|nr:class F sortase [Quadrisphaera sp. DSM 44207]SDQ05482.1 Sortase family protein [Quadrisphaera sp. DSM 44207]